jgi:hypothetical protein
VLNYDSIDDPRGEEISRLLRKAEAARLQMHPQEKSYLEGEFAFLRSISISGHSSGPLILSELAPLTQQHLVEIYIYNSAFFVGASAQLPRLRRLRI